MSTPTSTPPRHFPVFARTNDELLNRLGHLLGSLDLYLSRGKAPKEAIVESVDDYAYHFHYESYNGSHRGVEGGAS